MNVRDAQETDFGRVTELLEQLGRPRVADESYATARQIYLDQLEDEYSHHMVAVDEGQVVGFCSLHFRSRLNQATLQAWIPDLFVDPSSRGRGAAKALLLEAERVARGRGCHDLTLESGFERSEAHLLYSAAGMKEVGKSFWKAL